jgi:hypothetical protein
MIHLNLRGGIPEKQKTLLLVHLIPAYPRAASRFPGCAITIRADFMDYSQYENKLPYPDRATVIRSHFADSIQKLDEMPLTKAQRQALLDSLEVDIKNKWKEVRNAYFTEEKRLDDLFKQDAIKEAELDFLTGDARNAVYSYAWQQGHSSGISEVLNYLLDMEPMISAVWKAAKKS